MEILNDFNTSVEKSLTEIDPNWRKYEGLVVCGTHSPHDVEEILTKIKEYREVSKPYLGICFGHQLAAIEYARNVLGVEGATSQEFYPLNVVDTHSGNFIVKKRVGGLKVGLYPINPDRLDSPRESFWNNYEVIYGFEELWKKAPNFITVQYHPEYQSSKANPHPILVEFLKYARNRTMAV